MLLSAISGGMLVWVVIMYAKIGGKLTVSDELVVGRSRHDLGVVDSWEHHLKARYRLQVC